MPLDPHIAAILAKFPAWPGARNFSLQELRTHIRRISTGAGPLPVPLASIRDTQMNGPGGILPLRIYTPQGTGPFPLIVFFHGGGYVTGDLDTEDMIARALAYGADAVTVSVDYRLAPEHPFPAAADDALAALKWVAANADELDGDVLRLAVAGDSAGANLSASLALDARNAGGPAIAAQILFYGSMNDSADTPSAREYRDGPIVTTDDMDFFLSQWLGHDYTASKLPRAFALHAQDHQNLPPALIITAECDLSRDDGERYGEKLKLAGVEVEIRRYAGMPHGFVSWLGTLPAAQQAIDDACKFLSRLWRSI